MQKKWCSALIGILAAACTRGQTAPREQILAEMAKDSEKFCRSLEKGPTARLGSRALFDHALILCEARANPERLEKLFDLAARMQDRDPASRSYGNFRWYWNNDKVFDYNAVDFCMQSGGLMWLKHRDWIPETARAKLKTLLELGTQGCLRHRVTESYTNIALMNAQDLIILGEALGDKKAADEGYARLDRQCLYVWECGIHEYDSPTYYGVDLDALGIIDAYARRDRGKAQAKALLKLFWTDIGANFFWPELKLAGTRSRDYDYLRGIGVLDHHLWLAGWIPPDAIKRPSIHAIQTAYRPSPAIREMSQKKLPRLVRQIWGDQEGQFKAHYVMPDVTLGSSGACYHNMDIPLSVNFPGDRTGVRCYFIADGRHDPYGKIKIPEGAAGGHEKTLHLRPFFQASQRLTDAAAVVVYRDKDIPQDTKTLESHWVMPLGLERPFGAADEMWCGEERVRFDGKREIDCEVRRNEAVVLRKGTAAVGVRVLWARARDGGGARMCFGWDGNPYGAVRLTIDHSGSRPVAGANANPGAALWVRVGSGLKDQSAFEKWRTAFIAAKGRAEGDDQHVNVDLETEHGNVRVQAAAPYAQAGRFDPSPPKAVLEIDGEDVGRRILQNVEPIASYRSALSDSAAIAVAPDKGTYFEAERGAVLPGFAVGEDQTASEGKYVWLPGEPGGKGGGIGSVTWRLKLAKANGYYVWGRVLSPTPDDDSFYLLAKSGGKDILPQSTWALGVHREWTWVRFMPGEGKEVGKEPRSVQLPPGEVRLQLKAREDGAKIDRLFITPLKEDKPQ